MILNIHLKPIHIATANIIIDRSAKYVHRIAYHGRSMKHSTRWDLRIALRNNDGPHLGVQVVAVQIVGQCTVGRSAKHVQKTVVRDHGVAVASGRWRWGDPEDVFVGDATPAAKKKSIIEMI